VHVEREREREREREKEREREREREEDTFCIDQLFDKNGARAFMQLNIYIFH